MTFSVVVAIFVFVCSSLGMVSGIYAACVNKWDENGSKTFLVLFLLFWFSGWHWMG